MSSKLIAAFLILFALVINFHQLSPVKQELSFMVKNINLSKQDKTLHQFGPDYSFILFIQQNTPQDAIVAIPPPGAPWWNFGSTTVLNYFMWPRKMIVGKMGQNSLPREATHAMIAWYSKEGSSSASLDWPLVDLNEYDVRLFKHDDPKLGIIFLK